MKADYSFYITLAQISTLTVVIPLVIGLFRKKYFNSGEKILLYLTGLALLTEIIGQIISKWSNNMYVFHIYTVVEFIFISLFYIKFISPSRFIIVIRILIFLFIGIAAFDYFKEKNTMDDLSTTIESILFMLYSIVGFYTLLQNPVQYRVVDIPFFWFNTAILLYFAGNLFLFIFSSYIERHSHRVFSEVWAIHSIMNIIFYVLISIGFWKTKDR